LYSILCARVHQCANLVGGENPKGSRYIEIGTGRRLSFERLTKARVYALYPILWNISYGDSRWSSRECWRGDSALLNPRMWWIRNTARFRSSKNKWKDA